MRLPINNHVKAHVIWGVESVKRNSFNEVSSLLGFSMIEKNGGMNEKK
jgi:hypothetical protein